MRRHIAWIAAISFALAAAPAFAQTSSTRQSPAERQQIGPRVREGVRLGQITRLEAQRLRQRVGAIRQHGLAMRQDGQLTRTERQQLLREWRGASRLVFQLRHNSSRRGR
jgi:hypothetical protein